MVLAIRWHIPSSRPAVNGVAVANKGKSVFCLGSDGSQMEGNDAEAARLAVSENLNVKLIVDDNDVYGTVPIMFV